MHHFLDFEKPIAALEGKIEELRHLGGDSGLNIADEIGKLQSRIDKELSQTYKKLGPWEKVQVARHPERRSPQRLAAALLAHTARAHRPCFCCASTSVDYDCGQKPYTRASLGT